MNDSSLRPRQYIERVLRGQPLPRPAVGPLAVHYCAQLAGATLREYTTDARILADCVVRYYERFRPDAVWLSADTWVTAQAMGAAVDFAGDDQPLSGMGTARVRTSADIDAIPPPDPCSQGRCRLMLDALRRVRQALGEDVFVVACFDQYPFSLACALMGIDQVMLQLTDDRPLVQALMERGLEYALAYARALAQVGADMLSGGDSPAGLLGPRLYREVAFPYQQRLIAGLKSRVTQPISLHICGNTSHILQDMAATGAHVLELDHQVHITRACRLVGRDVTIWGNLDPVGLLARSAPSQVGQATCALLEAVQTCAHHRFVLSSGCTLALETPAANLDAMFDACRSYRLTYPVPAHPGPPV